MTTHTAVRLGIQRAETDAAHRGQRVIVGVAGHAESSATLAWAIAEAQATGAELLVVHATGPRRGASPALGTYLAGRASMGALETVDRSAASAVAAARSRLGEASVRIDVASGAAGDVLLRAAGPRDVVVIGGPSRGGWWVRPSTTYQVVTRARCPVIVVHEPYGRSFDAFATSRAPSGPVVVAVESGVPAEAPVRYGSEFADRHGLPLDVVTGRSAEELRRAAVGAALLVIGAGGTPLHPLGGSCRSLVAGADCPVAVIH
jgi:nucleotide-binding universal stress UspA family protein